MINNSALCNDGSRGPGDNNGPQGESRGKAEENSLTVTSGEHLKQQKKKSSGNADVNVTAARILHLCLKVSLAKQQFCTCIT